MKFWMYREGRASLEASAWRPYPGRSNVTASRPTVNASLTTYFIQEHPN